MPLEAGSRFGAFAIESALGAGGMGEVYRARDIRLGRAVALKLLPAAFAADAERIARFEREAQVLASLNHQNIAQIYGVEDGTVAGAVARALVMELVEGTTLAERMLRGVPPLDESISIARQIADAIEAAHEKGIIHRDLKPANVMITSAGLVKVLDFGLAAVALPAATPGADVTQSPTLTIAATQAGVILGTAAYMSPEQASGRPVDKRTDIWSFGVLLWEMLAGRRLFEGETISHTLADVLRADIDFTRLPSTTPRAILQLLQRCLDRDVKTRLRDIGEARIAIQRELVHPERDTAASGAVPGLRRDALAWAIALVAVVLAAAVAIVHIRESDPIAEPVRFQIVPPPTAPLVNSIVVSPDGRRYVYLARGSDNRAMLWERRFDSLEARPLSGTEGALSGPFWSPDSRFVAFAIAGTPIRLKRVDMSGGPPETVGDLPGAFRGGAWSPSGVLLVATSQGMVSLAASGGETPAAVTATDFTRRETGHAGAAFLPDGRRFLYYRDSIRPQFAGIFVGSLDVRPEAQSTTRLLAADSIPLYAPSLSGGAGWVLFLREGTLFAQRINERAETSGDSIPIADDVGSFGALGWFSVSENGQLAYRTGRAAAAKNQLAWFDRRGRHLGQLGPPIEMGGGGVQISPDGARVTITRTGPDVLEPHIWIGDVSRAVFSRLTSDEGGDTTPVLSPNGRVAFTSTANGATGDLYWADVNGVGPSEPLLVKSTTVKHPNDFSPDGRFLIFDDHTSQRQDLFVLPIDPAPPSGERKPIPFLVTKADETFGQFSPDGKWVAYSSDESGRREVFVQGFAPDKNPAAAVRKWTISTAGGDKPRWSADGKELYYISLENKMMAVPVTLVPTFQPGLASALFDVNVTGFTPYDVSRDGRFLLNTIVEPAAPAASPVTVVLNWEAGVKR